MANITGGVEIVGFISPTDTADTYAVIDPVYGVDGFRNVDDITARDAITSERRRAGMIVGVKNGAFNNYYVLNSGNTTWSQIQMVTGFTWDGGSYDLTLSTFGGGITRNLSLLASDVTVTGGIYNSLNGVVTFSSNTTNTRTGLYYAGNWSASSAYTANTVVTYTVNSKDYYSISDVSPSPTPPSGDTANWRPISSRGVFIVTGFTAGYTNIYTTAATYNQTAASIALDFTDPSKNLSITGVTSIYGKDDSIKSNRLVDLNQKTLNFSSSTAPNALTVSTEGTVGIGVLSGANALHVSATTNPVRFQGLAGISADTYVVSVDSSGVLRAFSATTGRIPFFNSNQITTNADFTYSQGASGVGTLNLPSVTPTINFGAGRGAIYSPGIPSGLHFETSFNSGTLNQPSQYPDPSKLFVFRNKPWNNDLVMSHVSQPNSKFLNGSFVTFSTPVAAFGGQVVINETSPVGPPNPIRVFWGTAGTALNVKSAVYTEANGGVTPATRSEIVANSFQIPTFSANTTIITTTQNYTTLSNFLMFYSASTTTGVIQSISIGDNILNNFYSASLFTLPSLGTSSAGTASSLGEILSATSTGYRGVSYSQIVAQTGLTDPGFFTGITTGSTTYYTGITSGVTYSALSNVYIAGAPIKGSNVSGNTYALKVNTGDTYFGGGLTILSGTNNTTGVAKLSSGSIVVSNNLVGSNSIIMLTKQSNTSTGSVAISSKSTSSFTITSTDGADTDDVAYLIIKTL